MPNSRPPKPTRRLSGIDAARGLALLGMMATHIMPLYAAGTPTLVGRAFSGTSSALFAVLAGVGLALYTGKEKPHQGTALAADRRGVGTRAMLIAVIGLTVGVMPVSIAIILVHYAVLFLLALPFLGMAVRPLIIWAAGWLLISPVVAYGVRPLLDQVLTGPQLGPNPLWTDLLNPDILLADLFFNGYYPVAQWFGYLLVGLVIGRLALSTARVQVSLLVLGAATAVFARGLGNFFMLDLGGLQALQATPQGEPWPLQTMMQVSLTPVEQSGSWWWLLAAAPHSGTTLDLLSTSATAAAAIGLCLLLTRRWPKLLLPLSGAGAMTLTLYTGHIIALGIVPKDETSVMPGTLYWIYAAAALVIGTIAALAKVRGPLELAVSTTAANASGKAGT